MVHLRQGADAMSDAMRFGDTVARRRSVSNRIGTPHTARPDSHAAHRLQNARYTLYTRTHSGQRRFHIIPDPPSGAWSGVGWSVCSRARG